MVLLSGVVFRVLGLQLLDYFPAPGSSGLSATIPDQGLRSERYELGIAAASLAAGRLVVQQLQAGVLVEPHHYELDPTVGIVGLGDVVGVLYIGCQLHQIFVA